MHAKNCIFVDSPDSCSFNVDSNCVMSDNKAVIVMCAINKRHLMLEPTEQFNLVKAFSQAFVWNDSRPKNI